MPLFTNENLVTGSVDVNNFPAVQPVSDNGGSLTVDGPLTNTELRATPVPVSEGGVGSATVTRVTVNTTAVTLAASNSSRRRLVVHNETGTLFVKYGTSASATDYTWRLTANTVVEIIGFTGEVTAIKATGSSFAQVTEI